MIDPGGRYVATATRVYVGRDGRAIPYLGRRFLPKVVGPVIARVEVSQGMRLDLIAFRWLGDPAKSWQVADANNAMNPFSLTECLGVTLVVAQPQL